MRHPVEKERGRKYVGLTLEILHSITEACLGSAVTDVAPLVGQVNEAGWNQKLESALHRELGVKVTYSEIESAGSLLKLSELLERRLVRDPGGRSLVDIYAVLEQFVREELSHEINYHWHATWIGDLLNNTDSLEDVEIVLRMEDAFGFHIPDQDVQEMPTVGQTVRYLWRRNCEQSFTLRQRPADVCRGAFVFNELRRLLIKRGGVPRAAVRLDTRLGDLLPTWHFQFWRQIPSIFGVDIPHGNLLTRILGVEKRTTIKELVALIRSNDQR